MHTLVDIVKIYLTHLPLDKLAISEDDFFKHTFWKENIIISIQISLIFAPNGLIDTTSGFVQVMAWRRTGDNSLPEGMMTQLTDAYMRH